MLLQFSRCGFGGVGGGLFGGGFFGIVLFMMLFGGGDGFGKMLMFSVFIKGS